MTAETRKCPLSVYSNLAGVFHCSVGKKMASGTQMSVFVCEQKIEEPQCSDSLACGPNPAHQLVILALPQSRFLFVCFEN